MQTEVMLAVMRGWDPGFYQEDFLSMSESKDEDT